MTLVQKIKAWIDDYINHLKAVLRTFSARSEEAAILEEYNDDLTKIQKIWDSALKNAIRTSNATGGVVNTDGGEQFRIKDYIVDDNGNEYHNVVLLDTDFFVGISPRNWGAKLRDFVKKRSINNPFIMPVKDENDNVQKLQFARENERTNNHKVNDELSFTSDNISKLAVIHIDEIIEVSEENNPYYTEENTHGKLDKNGWLHRNVNVVNVKTGVIYNLTVDIAKTEDNRIVLYATKGKIKKVGQSEVNSLNNNGSGTHPNEKIITDSAEFVKFSIKDSDGNTLSEQQAEYFKDSKIRDENGNLLVVYHGTPNFGFTTFDINGID